MKTSITKEVWEEIHRKIIDQVENLNRPASEVIIDDTGLQQMLKISRRTAFQYRKIGLLVYYKIESKIFYFLSDILCFIKKHGGKNE